MYRHRPLAPLLSGCIPFVLTILLGLGGPAPASAQDASLQLVATPAAVNVVAGETASLEVTVVDASGAALDVAVRFAAPRSALRYRNGVVQAYTAGTYEIVATAVMGAEATSAQWQPA